MSRSRISRRTLLRGTVGGTAVALGLPALECMLLPSGRAFADGKELPARFGVWFWGNGVRPEHWVPASTGSGYALSTELAPLAAVQDRLSVVSGTTIKTATHPHHSGMAGIFTGRKYQQLGTTRDTIVSTFAHRSIDQDAADWFSGATPFRSLEIGVTQFHGTDEGSTFQHLSHNGPNSPNASEYSPVQLYHRLFTSSGGPQMDLVRRSVLDAVNDQLSGLKRELGTADRQRLEQHADSIRTLENQIALGGYECQALPEAPTAVPDTAYGEDHAAKNALMSELLALALACDLTRSFSVMFSSPGSGIIWWEVGATDSLHSTCHLEAMPQPTVHAATEATMEQLAVFLETLAAVPEGDGDLLTNCSILCTSELADGYTHGNDDFPILIAGEGGGRLRPGQHVRLSGESATRAALTALHGAGVEQESFGADEGYTDAPITALLT